MSSVETQFHVPPFPPFPSAERYVRVGSQDDALQRVRRAVEAWEAISLVIGPPGTGKSLICQVLQQHFAREREVIVFGDATLESPQLLQRHLLNRLDRIRGIAPTPATVGDDPQLAIIERIAGSSRDFAGLLLLVDEAQTLKPEVLETIRILTNVMSGGRPRVSAVLLGGPKLDETLALPSLDALVQRVSTRCYLHPLSSDETVQYVQHAIKSCVNAAKVGIEESAIRAIHRACSGVPRLVNQLMTATMEFAASRGQNQITNQTVDHAWAVLQQLPSPLLDEPELSRPVSSVEFGPLTDETDSFEMIESSVEDFVEDVSEESAVAEEAFEPSEQESSVKACDAGQCDRGQCDPAQCDNNECDAAGCESVSAEAAQSDESCEQDFMVQAEVSLGCVDESQFGAVSYDCQAIGTFDYDDESEFEVAESADEESAASMEVEASPVVKIETPSPIELFGEFDEEEPIATKVGGPAAVVVEPVASSVECEAEVYEPEACEPVAYEPEACEPVARDVEVREVEPESDLESSLHREILSLRNDASAPVLWMEDGEPDPLVDDDRDLLVIEDDVEVEESIVVGEAKTDETPGTPIAVDFQSMLAKMRSPKR
ncbi:ExeA family protein [Aporhodopirellula aestuarii]|uniref:AAA family ATPase n=1 Tax=Aporhodopirellula aestuarii TaxID=2950107 RepID=A0ABT0U0K1_9BACT|nr:AAA family ATPase [Aporhodopirellula aestuarii]MCM2370090.1 AAA family ATPase [Aporhodopirellula aestuarii]